MHNSSLRDGFLSGSADGVPAVNRLLATLPSNEYKRLLPKLKTVNLVLGEVLYEPGDVIKYVYFPNNSVISLISELSETSWLEVGMVGSEGMAGLAVFMGGRFFVNTRSGAGLGHSNENEFSGCTHGSKPAWQFSSPPASLFALSTNSGFSIICVQSLSFG